MLPQTVGGGRLGTVHLQYRRCGSRTCHCRHGERHPAYYLFWRERGRLRKRYLKAREAESVRSATNYRRLSSALLRGDLRTARERWRTLTAGVRKVEHRDG